MGVKRITIGNPKRFNDNYGYGDYRINTKFIRVNEFEYVFSIHFFKLFGGEVEFEWKVFRSQSPKFILTDGVQDAWFVNGSRIGYNGKRIGLEDFKEIDKVRSTILNRVYNDSEVKRIMDDDWGLWKFPIHQI